MSEVRAGALSLMRAWEDARITRPRRGPAHGYVGQAGRSGSSRPGIPVPDRAPVSAATREALALGAFPPARRISFLVLLSGRLARPTGSRAGLTALSRGKTGDHPRAPAPPASHRCDQTPCRKGLSQIKGGRLARARRRLRMADAGDFRRAPGDASRRDSHRAERCPIPRAMRRGPAIIARYGVVLSDAAARPWMRDDCARDTQKPGDPVFEQYRLSLLCPQEAMDGRLCASAAPRL